MKLTVKNIQGSDQGELEVGFPIIENGNGAQAVHEVVVAYRAAQRSGTACAKTRAEVAGSGRKPWRQKGTGRARAGSFASPLWRGGGVVFGPRPRDYSKKTTKAVRRLALRKALSARLQAGEVLVLDDLKLETPKTKAFDGILKALEVKRPVLVVVDQADPNLLLASRNLPRTEITTGDDLNVYQTVRFANLVFTRGAFERVTQRLNPSPAKK